MNKQKGMSLVESVISLTVAAAIAWPALSYAGKNFDRLVNMDSKGMTEMVLENQCARVDERYIDVTELTTKKAKSATNLCGLDD